MKRISKRVLAVVVTLCMLVSLVPMASAADALFSKTLPESGVYEIQAAAANGKFSSLGTGVTYDANAKTYNFSTTDTNNSLRYDTSTPIKGNGTSADVTDGAITLEFDIAFTSVENPRYTSTIFTATGLGVLFVYGNELRLGTDLAIGTFANDDDPETEETVVPSGRVSLTFDVDAKTVTGSYAGGEAKTIAWNASKFRVFTFQLSNTVITGADAQEELKYSVGNITYARVRGMAPTMTSSIADGSKAVDVNEAITLTLSGEIDATGRDLSKIVLTNGSGDTIETTKTVNGSTVVVRPVDGLAEATTYTLTVDAGAVTVLNAGNPAASYSFSTGKTAPGEMNFVMNFDDMEGFTAGQIASRVKTTPAECGDEYSFHSGYLWINNGAVENVNGEAGKVDADDYARVENGKLHLKSTGAASELRLILAHSKTFDSGYWKISFDVEMPTAFNGNNANSTSAWFEMQNGLKLSNYHVSGGNARTLAQGGYSGQASYGAKQICPPAEFNTKTHKVEILFNADKNGQADNTKLIFSGKDIYTDLFGTASAPRQLRLMCPTGIGDMYIDNIVVQHIATPAVTATVSDGDNNVSTVSPITLTSPIYLTNAEWQAITLAPTAGGEADYTIIPDATGFSAKLKINTALAPSTPYTLTIPATAKAGTLAINMAADTINFTTSAVAETLYVSDYSVPVVAAGQNMAASATFGYAGDGSQTVMVGLALYGADHTLLKAAYNEYTFAEAGSETVTANFTAPAEIAAGAYVKVFAWKGGVAAMQPICAPLG